MDFFYSTSDNMIGGGYSDVLKSVALSKMKPADNNVRTYLWVIIFLIIISCICAFLMGDAGKMFSSFNTNLLISGNCLALIGIGMALAYLCSCETVSKVDTLTSLTPAVNSVLNPTLGQISPVLSQTLSPTMQSVIPPIPTVQSAIPTTQQFLPTGTQLTNIR